jgi:hypothetical protein
MCGPCGHGDIFQVLLAKKRMKGLVDCLSFAKGSNEGWLILSGRRSVEDREPGAGVF